ncbi:translation initiation factor IF-2-like [Felis catus]|uniref:translation initiation factor IF-2-like n=1 Tax=Felis catus TaxID=9685 RepID=UPI001D19E09D|nr:translation initiation factor IF-2-like [Felis catus]
MCRPGGGRPASASLGEGDREGDREDGPPGPGGGRSTITIRRGLPRPGVYRRCSSRRVNCSPTVETAASPLRFLGQDCGSFRRPGVRGAHRRDCLDLDSGLPPRPWLLVGYTEAGSNVKHPESYTRAPLRHSGGQPGRRQLCTPSAFGQRVRTRRQRPQPQPRCTLCPWKHQAASRRPETPRQTDTGGRGRHGCARLPAGARRAPPGGSGRGALGASQGPQEEPRGYQTDAAARGGRRAALQGLEGRTGGQSPAESGAGSGASPAEAASSRQQRGRGGGAEALPLPRLPVSALGRGRVVGFGLSGSGSGSGSGAGSLRGTRRRWGCGSAMPAVAA